MALGRLVFLTYGNEEDAFNMQEESVDTLNGPVTKEEVIKAVKSLKNGKSASPDGVIGELIKYSDSFCVDSLVKLLKKMTKTFTLTIGLNQL